MRRELIVLQDTREQHPWELPVRTLRRALKFGDYTARGLERILSIERKSAQDLVSSLSTGFDRFCRELAGAREVDVQVLLVAECSWRDAEIALRQYLPSMSLARRVTRLAILTGSTPLFMGDRETAAKFAVAALGTALEATAKLGNSLPVKRLDS